MTSDYAALYQHLGLDQRASLDEFRQACRRRIAELHPDRARGRAPPSRDAPIALDALIAMYVDGVRFHRTHGRLPGATNRLPPRMPLQRSAHAATGPGGDAAHVDLARDAAPPGAGALAHDEAVGRQRIGLALVGGLLALAILLAMTTQDDESLQAVDTSIEADGVPAPPGDARDAGPVSASAMTRVASTDIPGLDHAPRRLAIGMTAAQVRAIQGVPIRAGDGLWEYGPSWLRFERGRLVDWHSSPLRPLAVSGNDAPTRMP